ncbi:hypothetical protein NCAS_0H02970 [Naumovozyma castellii]|uniref:DUF676 domain-containing protein n=1 Tax=Naumovozyma castellii TaxID=27288 RepID=G0VJC8_NAUCA|nr:hypothetical protein NCAS_0H02970 [Naumovozyma castellii CBS 4309]CCC71607.1 hypothetical protein NCAS_0H02970 [Naumovozyma castellii CBS 4309]
MQAIQTINPWNYILPWPHPLKSTRKKQKGANAHSLNGLCQSSDDPLVHEFVKSYKLLSIFQKSKSKQVEEDILIDKFVSNPNYVAPKNPIVLCHGLSGFDRLILIPSIYSLTKLIKNSISSNLSDHFLNEDDINEAQHDEKLVPNLIEVEYWIDIKEKLEKLGCTVITTRVPSFGSIEERAEALHSFLEKETKKLGTLQDSANPVKLNLIAHSMGGLDCRYLISKIPKKNYKILSLTTISTPHRGSEMADYVVNLFETLKTAISSNTNNEHPMNPPLLPLCFYQLTTTYMKYFNLITPDDPSVSYFSYGCYFEPKWYNVFSMSWKIIADATNNAPNDGMVTVSSSKWGQYQGTLCNVDHLDIINWKNKLKTDVNKALLNLSNEKVKAMVKPDLDILQFYIQITDTLAKKGF